MQNLKQRLKILNLIKQSYQRNGLDYQLELKLMTRLKTKIKKKKLKLNKYKKNQKFQIKKQQSLKEKISF